MAEDRSVLSRPAPAPNRELAYGPQADQVIDCYLGQRSTAVVLVHGGYWRPEFDRLHLRPMAGALAKAGWTTYLIEYRRQPGDPETMVADVQAAIRASAGDHASGDLILIGHSAGGHLVLQAPGGLPLQARGVLALAPVADLAAALALDLDDGAAAAFLGTVPAARFCPMAQPDLDIPVLLLHGDRDELVPIEFSRGYVRTHPHTRLVELPGVGHFALIDPRSPSWPAVLAAVAELERRPPRT